MGGRRYWRRILVVNAVGALAAFGLLGGFVTNAPGSERVQGLVACLIYANCIGGIMALVLPSSFLTRYVCGSWLKRWVVRLLAIAATIVAGCAVAGVVLIAIGISRPNQYWM